MKTIEQLEAQRQENILKIRGDANARHWANILAKRALPPWKKPPATEGFGCRRGLLLGIKAKVIHRRSAWIDMAPIFFNGPSDFQRAGPRYFLEITPDLRPNLSGTLPNSKP